jgi:hypothetical protein
MHVCNLYNVTLQFDTELTSKEAVLEAVELINLALQREPYNLSAQIIVDTSSLSYDMVRVQGEDLIEE